jgi:mRNA interferase MazF
MSEYKQYDIFLVDFDPSVGHEFQKIRPAVIIQSNKTIINGSLITVIPLTSNLKNKRQHDIAIKKTDKNGLFKDSIIKVSAINSFDHQRLLQKIGTIADETIPEIAGYLRTHFGI